MNKWLKWALSLVGLATYLNVGWTIGTYNHDNIRYVNPSEIETTIDKFLAGPNKMINEYETSVEYTKSKIGDQIMASIFLADIYSICCILLAYLRNILSSLAYICWRYSQIT
jgi:hypothetical protein